MKTFLKSGVWLLAALSLYSCAEDLPNTNIDKTPGLNTTLPAGLAAISPSRSQEEVGLFTPIVVQFTRPIDESWLWALRIQNLPNQPFRFRVEDEAGDPVAGELTLNSAKDTITFVRKIGGGILGWNLNTRYTVVMSRLKDANGEYMHDYSYSFYTQEFPGTGTGRHRVIHEFPTDWDISPTDYIDIEFSEPIARLPDSSTTRWAGAIRVLVTEDRSAPNMNAFGIPAVTPQVDLLCHTVNTENVCDKLRILPPSGWPTPSFVANYLHIEIRPHESLMSVLGTPLVDRHVVTRWIFNTSLGGGP